MEVFFEESSPDVIVGKISEALGGRKLAKMVTFDLAGKDLEVKISKLGTSKLFFSHSEQDGGSNYKLTDQKIAISHRVFTEEVKDKLVSVIEKAGGKVLSRD